VLLNGGEVINVGGLEFDAVWTPGHTVGHIVYVLRSTTPPCLFTGDHLFIGGCGKVFEDTYDAMLKSLNLIKNMDHASLIFPGHEYSWSNIQFAMKIDPQNVDVQEKYEMIRRLRLKRYATIPSTLLEELSYNPFLRTESLSIRRSVGVTSSDLAQHKVLELIRKEKDQFKPS
jgi:hydroxyacylglutathione hydrolase